MKKDKHTKQQTAPYVGYCAANAEEEPEIRTEQLCTPSNGSGKFAADTRGTLVRRLQNTNLSAKNNSQSGWPLNMDSLPNEILLRIFSYLNHEFLLCSLSRVSKRFYSLCKSHAAWTRVDLRGMNITERSISCMVKQKLVGLFTLYLHIECTELLVPKMPILECTYRQLLEACARLDSLYICGGLSENFTTLCTILPRSLQQLTLKAVDILGSIKETPWESTVNYAALKSLTISSCFGFTSSHLLYLLHPHPCQSLVYLDLSFSESIFDGDIGRTAEQWGRYFPSLKFLGMRGVFRIDDQMNYAAVSLFQSIFDGSPLLEVVDLSANYPLWQPPSEKRELTKLIIHQLFYPPLFPGLVKSKVLLGLLRCPEEWVASFADEASKSLKCPSILTLCVDPGISDTPQRNHVVVRKRSHCNFSFRDLVNLSSRNSQLP